MNNFTKSFEQQAEEMQALTEKELLIYRNTKLVLYTAFVICVTLYVAEKLTSL